MDGGIINELLEEWTNEIRKEIPPEFREEYITFVKKIAFEVLSGKRSPEEIVSEIDDAFVEDVLKKGVKIKDIARRIKLLLQLIMEKKESEEAQEMIVKLAFVQPEIFYKIFEIYEGVLAEEEAKRRRVERALRVLSKVSQAVSKIDDEKALLKAVCEIIVKEGGYAYAWVGYKKEDKSVQPVAKAGEGDYAYEIKITWDESETGKGPTGTAIRTGEIVIVREIDKDQRFAPWREKALKKGYRSSIALPLKVKGEVIGALNIYAFEKDAFDEDEVGLLKEVAEVVSFGVTSIREAEERKKLEKLYRAIVESSKTGIIVVSNERIIYANKAAENLSGYGKEELVGRQFVEIFSESDREEILRIYKLAFYDPSYVPENLEVSILRKDGEERIVFVTATPVPDFGCVVLSMLDVTKLREVERKLKESEELYRSIFEFSPLGIVVAGTDMRIIDCNDAALKMVKMKREEVIGIKWIDLGIFDEEELSRAIEMFYRGLRGESGVYEFRIKVDGEERWINVFPVLLTKDNKPYAFLNIIEDVTEKKNYEREIKEALERLEILRSIDHAILSGKELKEAIYEALQLARRKLGFDLLACLVLGEDPFVVHDSDVKIDLNPELFSGVESKVVENVLELGEMTKLDVEFLKAGLKSYATIPLVSRGEKVGLLLAATRKTFSEKDKEKFKFLETLAGQLGIAIQEARLFEMRIKALKQIEDNIVTLATLVDKIKNPLAAITLLLEEIEGEIKEKIEEQVKKIVEIVRDIEKGWVESEDVRKFLMRNWEIA
ncbi:putative PAS/PAC sensor protein [Ferroglobus placidus DSM 10642]|uniref:histidine kinase n=1 Tax=Ferroglobus placidus (strain DSM 10642 / AEDII12DO) TaxID=589924 RepID=D3S1Y7_FERPA|nr:PAS domain S-box protein [Ferroglobus placidus]ADC64444.1 putative PAS/PAC sensor protein [Ferroglobus placidus DSM 10642]